MVAIVRISVIMTSLSDDDIMDLLAAYALGALDQDEIAQVSALLVQRPELRATLAELRAAADQLPYALPEATPPDDLRQRVLDRATGRSTGAAPAAPARLAGRARAWVLSLGALAVMAVLAAVIGWTQFATTRSDLANAQEQVAELQGEIGQLQAQVAAAQKVVASMGGDGGSGAILQTRSGDTLLVAQLPPLQPGRVYQLWRIQGNNPPASAGTFTVSSQGYGQAALEGAQQPAAGETVAVTNEPDGGSTGPTTQPLIVGTSANA
jgi:anti-sigma-K factor RskA